MRLQIIKLFDYKIKFNFLNFKHKMQNNHMHQKIPHYEFNSEFEMEHSENQPHDINNINDKNINQEVRNETLHFDVQSRKVTIHNNIESIKEKENTKETESKNNSKKFYILILIGFLLIIIICFSIIFPLAIRKGKNYSEENENNSDDIQILIDKNKNPKFIFEANDYYLVDKISRKNKIFTQGIFFDTNNTIIESAGLYGYSKLRRFNLKYPDNELSVNYLDSEFFAEGACLYLNKFILQLTWRERKM